MCAALQQVLCGSSPVCFGLTPDTAPLCCLETQPLSAQLIPAACLLTASSCCPRLVFPIAGLDPGVPLQVELFDKDFNSKEFLGQVRVEC